MKFEIDSSAFDKLVECAKKAEAEIPKIAERPLGKIHDETTKGARSEMSPHNRTGKTVGALVPKKIYFSGKTASMTIGFRARVYLLWGTPRHKMPKQGGVAWTEQDKELHDLFYGTRARRKRDKILLEEVQKMFKEYFDG